MLYGTPGLATGRLSSAWPKPRWRRATRRARPGKVTTMQSRDGKPMNGLAFRVNQPNPAQKTLDPRRFEFSESLPGPSVPKPDIRLRKIRVIIEWEAHPCGLGSARRVLHRVFGGGNDDRFHGFPPFARSIRPAIQADRVRPPRMASSRSHCRSSSVMLAELALRPVPLPGGRPAPSLVPPLGFIVLVSVGVGGDRTRPVSGRVVRVRF